MDCKKIQDMIITDYIDGEAAPRLKKKIEAHLERCSICREIEKAARKIAVGSFGEAGRLEPPEFLWERIKGNIPERQEKRTLRRAVEWVLEILSRRKPVFALATSVALIFFAVVFTGVSMNREKNLNDYMNEQVNFLADLNGDDGQYEEGFFEGEYYDVNSI